VAEVPEVEAATAEVAPEVAEDPGVAEEEDSQHAGLTYKWH